MRAPRGERCGEGRRRGVGEPRARLRAGPRMPRRRPAGGTRWASPRRAFEPPEGTGTASAGRRRTLLRELDGVARVHRDIAALDGDTKDAPHDRVDAAH